MQLAIQEEELSPLDIWGHFPHELRVVVQEGEAALADFTPPQSTRPRWNPVLLDVNRPELKELCEVSRAACVTLGWAYRWGVGGSADAARAADAFRRACAALPGGLFAGALTDAQREDEENAKHQGCVSYWWMVKTGLVDEPKGADRLDGLECVARARFSEDPIPPCVRSRLYPAGQRNHDPTLYLDLNVATVGITLSFFALHALGDAQRMAHLGYGLSAPMSPLSVDFGVDAGFTQMHRWDPVQDRRTWAPAFGLAWNLGLSWQPTAQIYFLAQFRAGFLWLKPDGASWLSAAGHYGGRFGVGFTQGVSARKDFFAELAVSLEGFDRRALQLTGDELIARARPTDDLASLLSALRRGQDRSSLVVTPMIVIGKTFW